MGARVFSSGHRSVPERLLTGRRHLDSARRSCYGAVVRYPESIVAFALVLSAVSGAAAPGEGMVVAKRDFPELVARAEQIVVGTVTAIREEPDASGTPFTLVTFSDLSIWKGNAGPTLTLRFYGGTAGDVTVRPPDMPTFVLGERDVVFVADNGASVCPLVGVWQGRYYVRADAALGTDVVEDSDRRPLFGVARREILRAPAASSGESGGPTPMTLDAFRQLVADELAHPQSGK